MAGGGGGGSFFVFYILIRIATFDPPFGLIFLILFASLYWFLRYGWPKLQAFWLARERTGRADKRETKKRERRVELAAAEAADVEPDLRSRARPRVRRRAVHADPVRVGCRRPDRAAGPDRPEPACGVGAPSRRVRPRGLAQPRPADRRTEGRVRRASAQRANRGAPRRRPDRGAAPRLRDRRIRPSHQAHRPVHRNGSDAGVLDARPPRRSLDPAVDRAGSRGPPLATGSDRRNRMGRRAEAPRRGARRGCRRDRRARWHQGERGRRVPVHR